MNEKKRVIITIEGGIPEIIEAPEGVDIEIWDYDTDWYDEADLLEDSKGRKYFLREM